MPLQHGLVAWPAAFKISIYMVANVLTVCLLMSAVSTRQSASRAQKVSQAEDLISGAQK